MNGPEVEEQLSGGRHLLQVFEPTLPPKSRSQLQHRHLISSSNGGRTAKLTVTTAKGKLKVILEESFTQHSNVVASTKSPKRTSPSQLRRKERRAADPAVRQRAAEHEAQEAAAASEMEEALPSPEKVRCNSALNILKTSPVKDDVREEVEVEVEEEVEKRPRLKVPEDYEDRANNDLWDWDADQEKVKEAEKLLRETDRCCFCDFDCPPPSEQENKKRYFGVLESLSDHIELAHPLAYEWLG